MDGACHAVEADLPDVVVGHITAKAEVLLVAARSGVNIGHDSQVFRIGISAVIQSVGGDVRELEYCCLKWTN